MSKLSTRASSIAAALLLLSGCNHNHAESQGKNTSAPPAVTSAIMSAYPDAKITSTDSEKEEIDLFEVSFTSQGKKHDADVMPDGTILSVEETLDESQVAPAALSAIRTAAKGAKITRIEKATKMADVNKTSKAVTKLASPEVNYEAGLWRDDLRAEVVVAADGTIVQSPKWKKKGEDKD